MTFIALAGVIAEGATAALVGSGLGTAAGATAVGAGGVGLMGAGTTAALASGIGAVGAGALGGAGLGALGSAITGGDVGKGALYGALGGGITGGLSSAVGALPGSAAGSTTGAAAGSGGGSALGSSTGSLGLEAAKQAINTPVALENAAPALTSASQPISGAWGMGQGSLIGGGTAPGIAPGTFGAPALGNSLGVGVQTAPAFSNASAFATPQVNSLMSQAPQFEGVSQQALEKAATHLATNPSPYAGTLFSQYGVPIVGAGAMLGNYLGGDSGPTQATPPGQPWNPLSYYKFDPRRFQPSRPTYIRTGYANGGITSLTSPDPAMMQSGAAKVNFMGEDAYPTSQQKLNFYASPTQMPTSAQQAMASYEPSTNPLTGEPIRHFANGGISDLGHYSDGGNLTRGPGDGVSDDIPATIAGKQPARLADGEFVVPARAVSELGNGSTEAGAKRLYAMVDQIQNKRKKSMGKKNIAVDSKARAALPV